MRSEAHCPGPELFSAFADGELDATQSILIEEHVLGCHACRQELERTEAIRSTVARDALRHSAPPDLRSRIEELATNAPLRATRPKTGSWLAPALVGAIAASISIFSVVPLGEQQVAIDGELVSDHVRSLQGAHLLDVETSSRHVVKPWFNGRIDFAPAAPELAGSGFPLAGGRLDAVDGRTAAVIVYRRRLHVVNLFIWRAPQSSVHRGEREGFSILAWSADGLRYAAVSDAGAAELARFRTAYEQEAR